MSTEAIIVTGIVVAVVSAIAISFFRTKSNAHLDTSQSWAEPTSAEMLEKIKNDLEDIKQRLQDQAEE